MLEPLFNKVAGLQANNLETPAQVFTYKYYELLRNNCFEEHLRTAASDNYGKKKVTE